MRIQITARHCDVPQDVLDRTREQIESLSKFDQRASAADVVFEEQNVTRTVEAIVHIDGAAPVVGRGEGAEFMSAVDQMVDRVARMLREQRKRARDHQAPPLSERIARD